MVFFFLDYHFGIVILRVGVKKQDQSHNPKFRFIVPILEEEEEDNKCWQNVNLGGGGGEMNGDRLLLFT